MSKSLKDKRRRTVAVQSGLGNDPAYQAIVPPLYLTSTFEMDDLPLDTPPEFQYSRTKNPTRTQLCEAITAVEQGLGSVVTSSGMAALTLILHLASPEDTIFAPYDCYGRSYRLLCALAKKKHFKIEFIDQYSIEALDAAFAKTTPKMVLIESPSNPVMRIADIAYIAEKTKAAGGFTVVDNTFLSPILQLPLNLGADIVYHSTTKFMNGHSDVVGGCVVTNNEDILTDLEFWANSLGLIGAPFDSFLTLRGLRTLELRVHRAQENAAKIAEFLSTHEMVEDVYYPGLKNHTGHEIAAKQQEGFGAMLSFTLKGDISAAQRFVKALEIFRLAQSLGGTESLINHPATMTHVSMGEEARAKAGVTDQLLRLSIGVEFIDDLIGDLTGALNTI